MAIRQSTRSRLFTRSTALACAILVGFAIAAGTNRAAEPEGTPGFGAINAADAEHPSVPQARQSPVKKLQELTKPVVPGAAEKSGASQKVGQQVIIIANPAVFGRAMKDAYSNKEFLSVHGTVHEHPTEAMVRSLAPLRGSANARAAVKDALSPGSIAVFVAFPLAQEAVREFVQNGRIDPRQFGKQIKPAALGGSFAGGVAGTAVGATVQTVLAGTFGPVGVVVGFFAKPLVGWTGGLVGAQWADGTVHGDGSFTSAVKKSIASIRPGRDIGSVVGGTVFMVVGQALIPIPGVGAFVGSVAGTVVGGWVGSWVMHEGPPANGDAAVQKGVEALVGDVPRASAHVRTGR